jgi:hypothetical protein
VRPFRRMGWRLIGGVFGRSVGVSSPADTRTDDDLAARLFMPFKRASISEMVRPAEALGPPSVAPGIDAGAEVCRLQAAADRKHPAGRLLAQVRLVKRP